MRNGIKIKFWPCLYLKKLGGQANGRRKEKGWGRLFGQAASTSPVCLREGGGYEII